MAYSFKTNTRDSWFFSTETEKSEVNGQTLWDPKKSSTSALIEGCSWSILYGDWSTSSGTCYTDTFMLGNLSIPKMTIESATSVSSMFTASSYMSGLVGLAWPDLKQTIPPQKSLIEFLPGVLEKPVFTVDFRHNSSDGSFNFGYIDRKLHDSDIVYTNVDSFVHYSKDRHHGYGYHAALCTGGRCGYILRQSTGRQFLNGGIRLRGPSYTHIRLMSYALLAFNPSLDLPVSKAYSAISF